jgi:uncharacterized membrane protein (DUF2068 family)
LVEETGAATVSEKRPLDITVLAIVVAISGATWLVAWGLELLALLNADPDSTFSTRGLLNMTTVLGLLWALLKLAAGYGLWQRRGWGLDFAVFTQTIGVVNSTIGYLATPESTRPTLVAFFVPALLSIGILAYLLYARSVREAFP